MKVIKYVNKRNENKFIEVHYYKCRHFSVKQYMEWSNGVKNVTGTGTLHRWRKANLNDLLEDYIMI